ncbi:tRNA-specific adenosine deaminase [Pseudohongiella nitratireducens]|jgi:tRNA(adenine34) deaminase|uniref:tRNA-specific adenosine deaminase n=1 Tax=Pseudohongiella nitratireducens TaxID=1768907 RepID=A0A917GS77_9GAMM|nr:tRNA adenosine(34) deaminase TadA [Pseudohongiella nitratireducens]MDF1621918.1 tRNA adenosine(34) deaminase TadA [Pseudohongiella nitratireducens]GGG55697.1 tRNA-specific adenosine deaminase [Pseudohongiella nitratireducens]
MSDTHSAETDNAFMQRALELADQAAALDEVPVGAVIVIDGEIVGEGFNRPVNSRDFSAHAEINAMRDACQRLGNYRLPGATLYVTIEPCTMCFGALVHARIERLVFGAPEPRYGAVVSGQKLLENGQFNHYPELTSGILEAECGTRMRDFFRARRK